MTKTELHNFQEHTELEPEAFRVYFQTLDMLVATGIDLGERERLEEKSKELIDVFELDERFFANPVKSLLFASIANRLVATPEEDYRTQEAMCETLLLIAGPDGPDGGELYNRQFVDHQNERLMTIYDQFTNHEISRDLEEAIKSGLLDGVKSRLGVSKESEEPYEVRVMNITSNETMYIATDGIVPSIDWDSMDDDRILEEARADREQYRGYVDGLRSRGDEFQKLTGDKSFPIAWVEIIDGKKILCMQLPTAEKIIYKDQPRSKDYSDEEYERDLALLEHEYVHTQQSLLQNDHPDVGLGLEELRAEFYSGNKHGYIDVKRHFMYLSAITGIKLDNLFNEKSHNGSFNPADFYIGIAKQGGLDYMLDLALVLPSAYFSRDALRAESQKLIASYVGGISDLQQKTWESLARELGEEVVSDRLADLVDVLMESDPIKNGRITLEDWVNYAGDTFIGQKVLQIAKSKKKSSSYIDRLG